MSAARSPARHPTHRHHHHHPRQSMRGIQGTHSLVDAAAQGDQLQRALQAALIPEPPLDELQQAAAHHLILQVKEMVDRAAMKVRQL